MVEVNMIPSTQISFDSETITVGPETQTERREIPFRQAADTDAFTPEMSQHLTRRR
jgi:hypothetical protein